MPSIGATPRRIGILTVSDSGASGLRVDRAGQTLLEVLAAGGLGIISRQAVLPDDQAAISETLRQWSHEGTDAIFTTGGTGLGPRDVTPQATLAVIDFEVPGMAEAMRAASFAKTPLAILSRAVAGVRGRTLIVNLPGSPKAVRECLAILLPVLPHALEVLAGAGLDHVDHGRT